MKVFFATWLLEAGQGETLTAMFAKLRLISYYHTKEKTKEEVAHYIQTGRVK